MTQYINVKVKISEWQKEKLQHALKANNFCRRLHTITIKVNFIFTIFIPSDPMRSRTTTFIKVNYPTFFIIRFFR